MRAVATAPLRMDADPVIVRRVTCSHGFTAIAFDGNGVESSMSVRAADVDELRASADAALGRARRELRHASLCFAAADVLAEQDAL